MLKIIGAALAVVIVGAMAVVGINAIGTATSVATAPGRVVQRTMETDNIINNYEWFHQSHANFKSRTAQISAHKRLVQDETNAGERNRLRIELVAMQQNCREIAQTYNARATMTNRSLFMGREAPERLNAAVCE